MKILITGGCGFIGSHIAEYHLAQGDKVTVVDNLSTGSLENINHLQHYPYFRVVQENLLIWDELEQATGWAERIYHMAAVLGVIRVLANPIEMLKTNILGYQRVLESVVKSKSKARIILASSSSVYGYSKKELLSELDSLIIAQKTHPLWSYAVSKITDEALTSAYCQEHRLAITPVRLFNTIGPRQTGRYGMVVPRFVQQACTHQTITIYGDGTQTRSFCDVRDIVVALDLIASEHISIGEPINLGNDHAISIADLAQLVSRLAKSQSELIFIPYKEAYGVDFKDIVQRKPDLGKLRMLTGFHHQWNLENTLDDLINYFFVSAAA
jgi:UDP-glucose 4-epimerase